jgi:hypothetical protein
MQPCRRLKAKNVVFWDIKTQFVPHRKHIPSPLQRPDDKYYVRFLLFTAVTMKNAVFWDVAPCGSCKNRRFGGTWRLLHQPSTDVRCKEFAG